MDINGSAFTISSAKALSYERVRGMVKMTMRKLGKKKVFCVMATDSVMNKGNAWHIAFYELVLSEEEVESIRQSFEHFRTKLNLGSARLFFVYGIKNTDKYIRNHPSVIELCKVA
jgi:hypothetical protein